MGRMGWWGFREGGVIALLSMGREEELFGMRV